MIEFLHGTLSRKEPNFAIIDVGGVGYGVHITLQTFEKLPEPGGDTQIHTYLHVREDAMQLFGFRDEPERQMFRYLLGISGIGPKLALNILSGCGSERLHALVTAGNIGALTSIPGIGRKTAERIIIELRDKLSSLEFASAESGAGDRITLQNEALLALQALGYARSAAEKALHNVLHGADTARLHVSEVIRLALKELSS
jgi:Holliday junction DNA helicase RuvA